MRNAGIVWRAFCAAILLLAGIFAFLVLATAPSKSQNAPGMQRTLTVQCGPFPLVMRQLTEKYGEAAKPRLCKPTCRQAVAGR
jgi:cytochrome oxidase Cu insertion factor (SCO1/SenC/PrrC family)